MQALNVQNFACIVLWARTLKSACFLVVLYTLVNKFKEKTITNVHRSWPRNIHNKLNYIRSNNVSPHVLSPPSPFTTYTGE